MKKIVFATLLLLSTSAFAQQSDPAFMQRAVTALQAQRNAALDGAAAQQARADGLQEELNKAQARIKELEAKSEPKKE